MTITFLWFFNVQNKPTLIKELLKMGIHLVEEKPTNLQKLEMIKKNMWLKWKTKFEIIFWEEKTFHKHFVIFFGKNEIHFLKLL